MSSLIFLPLVTMEALPRRLLLGCDSAFCPPSNRQARTSSTERANKLTHILQKGSGRSIYGSLCGKTSTVQQLQHNRELSLPSINNTLPIRRQLNTDTEIVLSCNDETVGEPNTQTSHCNTFLSAFNGTVSYIQVFQWLK